MSGRDVATVGGLAGGRITPIDGFASRSRLHDRATGARPSAIVERWRTLAERGRSPDVAPPARRWLLERDGHGFLARGIVGIIAGDAGLGKSMLVTQLALRVATGGSWLGIGDVVQPGCVVLGQAEEDQEEVDRRLHYLGAAMLSDDERRSAYERIVAIGLSGEPVRLVQRTPVGVGPTDTHAALLELVKRDKPVLVILDPLSVWGGGGCESDNEHAVEAIRLFAAIANAPCRPTVLVVHHSSKWANREGRRAQASAAAVRGVTGLVATARWVCNVVPAKDRHGVLVGISKTNYTPPAGAMTELVRAEHGYLRPATNSEIDARRIHREQSAAEAEAEASRKRTARIRRSVLEVLAAAGSEGLNRRKLWEALKRHGERARKGDVLEVIAQLVAIGEVVEISSAQRAKILRLPARTEAQA